MTLVVGTLDRSFRPKRPGVVPLAQFIHTENGANEVYSERPVGAEFLCVAVTTAACVMRVGDYRARTFTSVDDSADTVEIDAGDAFIADSDSVIIDPYLVTEDTTLPGGLAEDTVYHLRLISTSPDVVAFYASDADARADENRIDLDAASVGTHTIAGIAVPAAPEDPALGQGALEIDARGTNGAWPFHVFAAPDRITFGGGGSALYQWWWA